MMIDPVNKAANPKLATIVKTSNFIEASNSSAKLTYVICA